MLSFVKGIMERLMTSSDKVKVTIAVAVDEDGDYYAVGNRDWTVADTMQECLGNISPQGGMQTYLITVEVPRPQVLTIELPSPVPPRQNVTGFIAEVKG